MNSSAEQAAPSCHRSGRRAVTSQCLPCRQQTEQLKMETSLTAKGCNLNALADSKLYGAEETADSNISPPG